MIDLVLIAKVCGAAMGIMAFVLYVAKLHRDLFIAPWFDRRLQPIQEKVDIVAHLLRDKYREEYEQAQRDVERDNRFKGVA